MGLMQMIPFIGKKRTKIAPDRLKNRPTMSLTAVVFHYQNGRIYLLCFEVEKMVLFVRIGSY